LSRPICKCNYGGGSEEPSYIDIYASSDAIVINLKGESYSLSKEEAIRLAKELLVSVVHGV
jgi:hypothetical protein